MFDVGTTVILSSPLIHHRNGARSPGPGVTAPAQPRPWDSAWELVWWRFTMDTGHWRLYSKSGCYNAGRAIFINKIEALETINLILCKPWSLVEVSMRLRSHWPDELGWEGRRWEGEGCSLGAPRQSLSDLDRANISHIPQHHHLHEFFFLIFLFLNFLVYRKFFESFGSLKIVRNSVVVVTENRGCHLRDSSLVTRELVIWSPTPESDTWHVTWAASPPWHQDSDGTRAIPSMSRRTLSRLKISYFLLFLFTPGVRYLLNPKACLRLR